MNQRSPLDKIPNELWTEICAASELSVAKNISLTCRHLHHICISSLFRSLYITTPKRKSGNDINYFDSRLNRDPFAIEWAADIRQHTKALEALVSRQEIVCAVKSCSIVIELSPGESEDVEILGATKRAFSSFLLAIDAALARLVRLRKVTVKSGSKHFLVLENLLAALEIHPTVDHVHFDTIRFKFDGRKLTSALERNRPMLKLRHLRFDQVQDDPPSTHNRFSSVHILRYFSFENLESLHFPVFFNRRFSGDIRGRGEFSRLAKLSVYYDDNDPESFSTLLRLCPQLRRLIIVHWCKGREPEIRHLDDVGSSRFAASTLVPHLTMYYGPSFLAPAVIFGRPVSTIVLAESGSIKTYQDASAFLAKLTDGIAPVEHFRANERRAWTADELNLIGTLFSQMKTLELQIDSRSTIPYGLSLLLPPDLPGLPALLASGYLESMRSSLGPMSAGLVQEDYHRTLINKIVWAEITLPPTLTALFLGSSFPAVSETYVPSAELLIYYPKLDRLKLDHKSSNLQWLRNKGTDQGWDKLTGTWEITEVDDHLP